jgi:cytochrome d ubiquinol oxidase subunit II
MFGSMTHEALQNYWWLLNSVLGALLVFLFFVQGGQSLIWQLGKNEDEKALLVNTLGRKWELGFTTLVVFGGAMFASFPLFYATSFGGAYWVWLAILLTYILQAVSYEYRKKEDNMLGQKTFEGFLHFHGIVSVLLIGIAVATFFSGSAFSLNNFNQGTWLGAARGLEAALNPFNLLLGLALVFLSRVLGSMYIINATEHAEIHGRARKQVLVNTLLFLPFFLGFVAWLLVRDGFGVDANGVVSMVPYKYLKNLFELQIFGVGFFLVGVVLVLLGIFVTAFRESRKGIWLSGLGTTLVVLVVFFLAGYNGTSFYPSYADLQSSLTIRNASSSHYTLTVMSYVSLAIPFVLAYISYVWRAMNAKDMTIEEIQSEHELY